MGSFIGLPGIARFRRLAVVILIFAGVLLAAGRGDAGPSKSGAELWRGLKWGMSSAEIVKTLEKQGVHATYDEELRMIDSVDKWDGHNSRIVIDLLDDTMVRITAVVFFAAEGEAIDFKNRLGKELSGKYGKPDKLEDREFIWSTTDTSITVVLAQNEAEPIVSVVYEPIEEEEYTEEPRVYYRVKGVESWDVLYIRERPNPHSPQVGSIPYDGKCVLFLNSTARYGSRVWYKVKYDGAVGWSSSKFLTEQKDPYKCK